MKRDEINLPAAEMQEKKINNNWTLEKSRWWTDIVNQIFTLNTKSGGKFKYTDLLYIFVFVRDLEKCLKTLPTSSYFLGEKKNWH